MAPGEKIFHLYQKMKLPYLGFLCFLLLSTVKGADDVPDEDELLDVLDPYHRQLIAYFASVDAEEGLIEPFNPNQRNPLKLTNQQKRIVNDLLGESVWSTIEQENKSIIRTILRDQDPSGQRIADNVLNTEMNAEVTLCGLYSLWQLNNIEGFSGLLNCLGSSNFPKDEYFGRLVVMMIDKQEQRALIYIEEILKRTSSVDLYTWIIEGINCVPSLEELTLLYKYGVDCVSPEALSGRRQLIENLNDTQFTAQIILLKEWESVAAKLEYIPHNGLDHFSSGTMASVIGIAKVRECCLMVDISSERAMVEKGMKVHSVSNNSLFNPYLGTLIFRQDKLFFKPIPKRRRSGRIVIIPGVNSQDSGCKCIELCPPYKSAKPPLVTAGEVTCYFYLTKTTQIADNNDHVIKNENMSKSAGLPKISELPTVKPGDIIIYAESTVLQGLQLHDIGGCFTYVDGESFQHFTKYLLKIIAKNHPDEQAIIQVGYII